MNALFSENSYIYVFIIMLLIYYQLLINKLKIMLFSKASMHNAL
jgi:hypothetical protein